MSESATLPPGRRIYMAGRLPDEEDLNTFAELRAAIEAEKGERQGAEDRSLWEENTALFAALPQAPTLKEAREREAEQARRNREAAARTEIWDPADLDDDEEEGTAYQWYPMPDGRRVCIHAPTPEDAERAGRAVVRALARLGLFRETKDETDAQALEIEKQFVGASRRNLWLVYACTRQGPEEGAPRVFNEKTIEAFARRKRMAPVLDEMAGVVLTLEAGQATEARRLREWLTGFFAALQSWHAALSSSLKAGRTAEAEAALERLAVSASEWKQHEEPWSLSPEALFGE